MSNPFGGFERMAEAQAAITKAVSQTVRKAAFDCEGHAKANVPVQTGFLKSSIYVETHDGSDYDASAEPPGDAEMLPEIPRAENAQTAYVAVGASYGVYVEMGTVKMAAQPYLVPAMEAVKPGFMAALEKLEAQMRALGFVGL